MVFQRKDDWVWGGVKGMKGDGMDDFPEKDFGREGIAMVDDGLTIGSIPAIQFNAAATSPQGLNVTFD